MNQKQRNILLVTAATIALMIAFPPYAVTLQNSIVAKAGYGFIFDLPDHIASGHVFPSKVNIATLLAQVFGVLLVGGMVFWANATFIASSDNITRKGKSLNPSQQKANIEETEPQFDHIFENQITPRTSGWLRFFARMFDVWWETLLVNFILIYFLSQYSAGFVN
jgi:hypothetical protein